MANIDSLLTDLRARGIGLSVEAGDLRVNAPRGALSTALRSEIRTRKAEIVDFLTSADGSGLPPLEVAPRRGHLPLSFIQERLWFLHQLDPLGSAHNIAIAMDTGGSIDLHVLRRSLAELLRRHEVLRCVFPTVDGEPVCVVTPPGDVALRAADVSGLAPAERAAEHARLRDSEVRAPIDLAGGPLIRFMLISTAPNRAELLVTQHHMVTDRWSLGLLVKELAAIYEAFRTGAPSPLPSPPLQYVDFAAWQRSWLQGAALEQQLAFWRSRLEGAPPALEVAADRPRPTLLAYGTSTETLVLPKTLAEELARVSRAERCSMFMTLLAAYQVLLARHSGQTDIVVGSPVGGRPMVELESMLGCFINTVVFRSDLDGNPTFAELLRAVRPMVLDALSHQYLPFEKLVQEIQVERDPGRSPLVQVGFVYQNFSASVEVPTEVEILTSGGSAFDLTLYLVDTAEGLSATLEFSEALYDRATAAALLQRYRTLLEAIAADREQRLADLPILSAEERRLVLGEHVPAADPAADASVVDLVVRCAARRGDAVAVTSGGRRMTYAELDASSTRVAERLRELGAGRGSTVAVALERSVDLVVALLGVLRSGATYLPLDPAHPQSRLDYTLADAGAEILLTHEPERWTSSPARILTPEDASAPRAGHAPAAPPRPTPEDIAYVIYTSGSTGRPKGVEVPHRAIANFLASMRREPGLEENDVLLSVTTPSFDISMLELLLPLVVGATVVVATREQAGDGRELIGLLERHDVTVMQATPSTWRMLVDDRWGGRRDLRILTGGEALPRDLADALLERGASVWNLYGPTETTVWSTVQRVEAGEESVPIGRPIDNTHVLILDRHGGLAPLGVPGEIAIGGHGVARGYRGRPELTAERFVEDTLTGRSGGRLYRTGDLGRRRPDGHLEYLGRMDDQVKVRGFRIELGEVESTLRSHADVRAAAAAVRDGRLVAFLVYEPGADLTVTEVRRFASRELPDYMVPSMVVEVSELPMTLNGKVDRKALPDPFGRGYAGHEAHEPPATDAERVVASVWSELLGVSEIGAHDNFYEVGGHSLLSIRAVHAIEQQTGSRVDPRRMFFQSLRQIAETLP